MRSTCARMRSSLLLLFLATPAEAEDITSSYCGSTRWFNFANSFIDSLSSEVTQPMLDLQLAIRNGAKVALIKIHDTHSCRGGWTAWHS
ncbi:hypothetical protein DFJ73DRAFT_861746 [Zopfochytrium polystomum]|nr:hypothetical protein DFJ73DRAFT_861746 [Zopfochytrium polystomum]